MLMQIQVYKLCLTTSVRGDLVFLLNIIHSDLGWVSGNNTTEKSEKHFRRIYFDEVSYLENRLRCYNISDNILFEYKVSLFIIQHDGFYTFILTLHFITEYNKKKTLYPILIKINQNNNY